MANVPIFIDQGGAQMTIGEGATLTIDGTLETGASGSITVADDSITTAKLADQAATFAKALVFVSTEQTATGGADDVAHGLGVDPSAVLVVPSSNVGLADGEFDIAYTTDATNVSVTATSGLTFYVMAWG